MDEWISVKDKTPNEDDIVLIYSAFADIQLLGAWNNSKQQFEYIDGECYGMPIREVTHWMPLPEPPAKESDSA